MSNTSSSTIARNSVTGFAKENAPSKVHRTGPYLYILGGATNGHRAYVYFARPMPLGATVISAKLRMTQRGGATTASYTLGAQRVVPWNANTMTWNNQPAVIGSQVSVTKANSPHLTVWEWDVTEHMQEVAAGSPMFGWRVASLITNTSAIVFSSVNEPNADYRPSLEVQWAHAPAAPTTLAPSGGRATSLAKPIVTCNFTDVAGDTTMAAMQVQMNATDSWGSPSFDSGEVATTVPQLNLATTSYAGLAVDGTVFWRCRVKDGAGLWSGWSDPESFTRKTKGTLAITNPADAPNNFVEEATPPFTHTFTGRTQVARQVLIVNPANPTTVYGDSKKLATTATEWTPTSALKLVPGASYRLVVRIWDEIARESTPGDPAYTEAVKDFTFTPSAVTTPTADLVLTPLPPKPWMQLDWNRATAPDSFAVVRDGVVIETGLDNEDLFVSGTSYRWIDVGADPRQDHTWSVQAVVNGKASANNDSATGSVNAVGIWLSDPDNGQWLQIQGKSAGTHELGEVGENFEPHGSTEQVRIYSALRGYEGSVEGVLVTHAGTTAQERRDLVLDFRRREGRVFYLTLADMTIPVIAYEFNIKPTPRPTIDFEVSFSYFQVAG